MQSSAKSTHSPATAAAASSARETTLRRLPPTARAALLEFQASGDPAGLNPVILAILDDFRPAESTIPVADLPGETRLIADLGFDSLAITEVVFTAEELFGITITNEEIIQVRTLDDLRGFLQVKVADRRGH